MRRVLVWPTFIGLMNAFLTEATACPMCQSDLGKQVRQGILDHQFGFNLIATLLPFPILLFLAVAIYRGLWPFSRNPMQRRDELTRKLGGASPDKETTSWTNRETIDR